MLGTTPLEIPRPSSPEELELRLRRHRTTTVIVAPDAPAEIQIDLPRQLSLQPLPHPGISEMAPPFLIRDPTMGVQGLIDRIAREIEEERNG
jgi:hypothetical protein